MKTVHYRCGIYCVVRTVVLIEANFCVYDGQFPIVLLIFVQNFFISQRCVCFFFVRDGSWSWVSKSNCYYFFILVAIIRCLGFWVIGFVILDIVILFIPVFIVGLCVVYLVSAWFVLIVLHSWEDWLELWVSLYWVVKGVWLCRLWLVGRILKGIFVCGRG